MRFVDGAGRDRGERSLTDPRKGTFYRLRPDDNIRLLLKDEVSQAARKLRDAIAEVQDELDEAKKGNGHLT